MAELNQPGGDESAEPVGDTLPEELDVTAFVGPYLFPSTRRRRATGVLYLIVAAVSAAGYVGSSNHGLLAATILLAAVAGYHFLTAWPVGVDQTEALAAASRTVGFPVGHASGQLGARGLRARPSWRILVFSADDPPSMRGLVELDAIDATILGQYTEENPEQWTGDEAPAAS